ncbi:enoyl-[acyl-carrier-protein] reductase, mitochondrial [Frankliniella occidentalis]|uniref:Enoyl-[acyl-carrier-protein] reductase, mitochondrial n=1 Tax=Frankliniella occidentalis TaxID=133901 RepID=A0A6J1S2E5_FRAOC|nr:enoyl-[acyl-carrier-protein] reductase, mitochondrial [Frankliniella occidentalis]
MNCHRSLSAVRRMHTIHARKLLYCDYGEPSQVVKLVEEKISTPQSNQIVLEMLGAPINPADINTVQGVYPIKPPLPSVPGNEGVGRVLSIGSDVKNVSVGDTVVPLEVGLGTWRTHGLFDASQWMKVSSKLGIAEAATLLTNPPTAYRMLKDFVSLNPGDVVIQNGANSACGQYVIQLCNAWNLTSVNVVRDRPNINDLKDSLLKLGASHVLTEEELRSTSLFKSGGLKAPKLALNCVGGQSGMEILRKLQTKGVHVTYGGMSRHPVTAPTSALIFKDVQLRGFWMSRWSKENATSSERQKMFQEIIDLMLSGAVKAPTHKLLPFKDYDIPLKKTLDMKGFTGQKFIFTFSENV